MTQRLHQSADIKDSGKTTKSQKSHSSTSGEILSKAQTRTTSIQQNRVSKRLIIDLVFTKKWSQKDHNGVCRHPRVLLKMCVDHYAPPAIREYGRSQLYGHGFRAWVSTNGRFTHAPMKALSKCRQSNFMKKYLQRPFQLLSEICHLLCGDREQSLSAASVAEPFIHADETPINIRGVTQYVWVFTDGNICRFQIDGDQRSNNCA